MNSGKDLVAAYVDAFNRGDIDAVCNLFAPDGQVWGVMGWGGIDKLRPVWKLLIAALQPHLQLEALAEEGNVVVARFTERGKSVGEFHGHAPTGKTYEVLAMEWFEIADGRIQRRWGVRDFSSISRQLGFIPRAT